jgi:signal transduction histidine kinase
MLVTCSSSARRPCTRTSGNWISAWRSARRNWSSCGSRQRLRKRLLGRHEPQDPCTHPRRAEVDTPAGPRGHDAKAGRTAWKFEAASRHLLTILNDILDLSKVEASKLQLEVHDFWLPALQDHVTSMVSSATAARGLRVLLLPHRHIITLAQSHRRQRCASQAGIALVDGPAMTFPRRTGPARRFLRARSLRPWRHGNCTVQVADHWRHE